MPRIHACLAVANFLVLLIAFGVGLTSQARQSLLNPDDPTYLVHFFLGLFAVLLTLAVHCLVFIYFLGTGRWVKEVAIAYRLPDEPLPKLTRELKRQTFPVALFAMLFAIATAAAGAGAQKQEWPWYYHMTLATLTIGVNLYAYIVESVNVRKTVEVIGEVMKEVDRIRADRGLSTNDEALREQEAQTG